MSKRFCVVLLSVSILLTVFTGVVFAAYEPPPDVSRAEIVKMSNTVMALPDIKVKSREENFRIRVLDMDWDIGGMVFEPEDPAKIPVDPYGKKIGVFFLHGGSGDHRTMQKQSLLVARKFGYKVATMTYLGRLYL